MTALVLGRKWIRDCNDVTALLISLGARCSLAASILFTTSFGAFSYVIDHEGAFSHRWLVLLFFLAGSAAVSSYFSALFATRSQSATGGLATSIPLALFGLSPLFLSYVASLPTFQLSNGELNAPRFLAFLAVGAGSIHLISTFGLRVQYDVSHVQDPDTTEVPTPDEDATERTPLVKKPIPPPASPVPRVLEYTEEDGSVMGLLSDSSFWLFAIIFLVITGSVRCFRIPNQVTQLTSHPCSPKWSFRTSARS